MKPPQVAAGGGTDDAGAVTGDAVGAAGGGASERNVPPQSCQSNTLPLGLLPLDEHAFGLNERC